MATISKEVLGRFPTDLLFFIISAGLSFTLFFPFDIMGFDFTAGVPFPSISNLQGFLLSVEQYYKPCVLVKYLADFPNGLVMIILVSLVPGLTVFFLFEITERVNGIIVRGYLRRKKGLPFSLDGESQVERIQESIAFDKWLAANKITKYVKFLVDLQYVPLGCLFSLEYLFAISLILTFFTFINGAGSWILLSWTGIYVTLGIITYLVHFAYQIQLKNRLKTLYDTYKSEKLKPKK